MTSAQVMAAASVVIALAMVMLVFLTITIGLRLQRSQAAAAAALVRLRAEITPLIENATTFAANLKEISGSLRGDVRMITETVSSANERVHQAVVATERRLNEFNALLRVVQDEAEDLFVATASTVHGVRHGAATLRERGGTDLASDELDDDELADLEPEEDGNGDDSDSEQSAATTSAAPRVRPRVRGGRRT